MSKPEKSSAKKLSTVDWIVRGVLFAVLAVLVVVAIMEFGVRRQATGSHAAVSNLLAKETETQPLRKSQVKSLIQGSPQVESVDPKTLNSPLLRTAERYTWRGLIRNYSLTIGYSLGDDPEVELVDAK